LEGVTKAYCLPSFHASPALRRQDSDVVASIRSLSNVDGSTCQLIGTTKPENTGGNMDHRARLDAIHGMPKVEKHKGMMSSRCRRIQKAAHATTSLAIQECLSWRGHRSNKVGKTGGLIRSESKVNHELVITRKRTTRVARRTRSIAIERPKVIMGPLRKHGANSSKEITRVLLISIIGKTEITGAKQLDDRGKPTGSAKVWQRLEAETRSLVHRSLGKTRKIHQRENHHTSCWRAQRQH